MRGILLGSMGKGKAVVLLGAAVASGFLLEVALWPLAKMLASGEDRAVIGLAQIGSASLAMTVAAASFYRRDLQAACGIRDSKRLFTGFAIAMTLLVAVWSLRAICATRNLPLEVSQIPNCVVLFLFVAIREEVLFRFLLFARLAPSTGTLTASLLQAAVFAAAHAFIGVAANVADVAYLFGSALFSACLLVYTGSLFVPIALHAVNDLLAAVLFGFNDLSRSGLYFDGILAVQAHGMSQAVISGAFGVIYVVLAWVLYRRQTLARRKNQAGVQVAGTKASRPQ